KNDKLMQEYQKSLNTLKKPINVPYKQETEKVGGLFSKETQETGNVVISQEDFDAFQKQIEAAQLVTEDYEYIKSEKALNDLKNENSELKEENRNLSENLEQINDIAKEQQKQLNEGNKLIKVIKEFLKKLEQAIGRKSYITLMNDVTKDNNQMKDVVRGIDKQINPEKYQEQEKEQKHDIKKDRGHER
ncbi:plasmid recombination enzyme, partial [Staphylococcus aureus]|nr:plasmid recombination enzyme [Staphylococcus aureus]MDM5877637.1 plasmid recombination enzyme [Staphylococcus aureus]MDM5919689.1 plasmid recombination enzyme [Staphylococcus aureus]MDM6135227.1 plasmid recombination enzyme [Staphylococcus aureus]